DAGPASRQARRPPQGAVQPALPEGHRPAGEDVPGAPGAPGYRPDRNGPEREVEAERGLGRSIMPKRIMEGTVVSTKMDKPAVVRVERTFIHPLFKKTVRRSKRYHAHDADNAAKLGQRVEIQECPPRSKLKRWEIVSFKGDAA